MASVIETIGGMVLFGKLAGFESQLAIVLKFVVLVAVITENKEARIILGVIGVERSLIGN